MLVGPSSYAVEHTSSLRHTWLESIEELCKAGVYEYKTEHQVKESNSRVNEEFLVLAPATEAWGVAEGNPSLRDEIVEKVSLLDYGCLWARSLSHLRARSPQLLIGRSSTCVRISKSPLGCS